MMIHMPGIITFLLHLLLIAHIIEIQELNFTNIYFREFDQSEPGR